MTLTDKEVALILTKQLSYGDNLEGESPCFILRVVNKNHINIRYKGGVIDPEALEIAPRLDAKNCVIKAIPTIPELELDYVGVSQFSSLIPVSTEEVFKHRLAVCRGCTEWIEDENHPRGFCDKANRKFIWLAKETCPDDKWASTPESQP